MMGPDRPDVPRPPRSAVCYGLMILGTVALFLLIRAYGETLVGPAMAGPVASRSAVRAARVDPLPRLLLALLTIIVACRAMGRAFRALQQPPVVGEVLAGILLGPSLLGRVAPGATAYLLPPEVAPVLGMIAQLGVILYMFVVGLELDTDSLWRTGHAAMAISHASIIAPFLLGAALAVGLYPRLAPAGVTFTVFAMFLGVATSVTAFPVLARILTDRRISRTPLGVMALTCAAVDDVTAWCLLALAVGVAQAKVGGAVLVLVGAAGYILAMLLVVRPLLLRWVRFDQREDLSQGAIAAVLVALLLSAWATEALGIHGVFGAFLLGAVIPHDSVVSRQLGRKLQDVVAVLLLPAFFAYTGMRTQIGLVSGPGPWLTCALIVLVATAGKFGGTLAAARLLGTPWRESAALGILMNTRGLMELVVLNIGLDLGIISPALFAMMVVMALVTTIATTPILHLLTPRPAPQTEATLRGPTDRRGGIAELASRS
jgi:Kef-type K+ transport system membrane component KefB